MYWAHLDTSNFNFDAFGRTKQDAEFVITRLCILHCQQTGIDFLGEFLPRYWDGIHFEEIKIGYGFRDGMPVYDRTHDEP